MTFKPKKFREFLAVLCLLFIAFACAPKAYRAHPQLEMRAKNVKHPGLVRPDIDICELTAGGVRELRDDWCEIGETCVLKAMVENLSGKEIKIKTLEVGKDIEKEVEDIQPLYRAVSLSIQLHTYGPYLFPEKKKNFEYSIGPIDGILQKFGADALIFVYGIDEISTAGRKALKAASVVVGAFTGVVVMPRSGMTILSVALVEAPGTILWYCIKSSQGGYDLRKPKSASDLVENVLRDFPRLGK
jgi:hypothetical protein